MASRSFPPLVIGVVIMVAMGGAAYNGFVYDDVVAIAGNDRAHDPSDLATIFTSPYWTNTLYRPVTTTGFAMLWQVGGGSPVPFHVANLALLLAVCLLLRAILRLVGASPTAALAGALLFAVHPVHVEVVANGVGLAELLSTALLLAGAIVTLRRPKISGSGLILGICGLLAFLSKESGITALALIPLLWWAHQPSTSDLPRPERREAALLLLLFLGLGLAVRTSVLGQLGGEAPMRILAALDHLSRVQTVLGVIPEWARLLIWPAHLQADYGPPQIPIGGPLSRRHILGVLVLFGWGAALMAGLKRGNRLVAAGLLWIPIALSPVSNLLFPTGVLLAERTLFLPSVGVALIAAGLVNAMPRWRTIITVLATVLVVLGVLRSHSRVRVWYDQETFFRQIVVDGSRSYRSWYAAGGYASRTGDAQRALDHLGQAWNLEKRDFRVAEEYGQALRVMGRHDEAIVVFGHAFEMEPNQEPLTSRLLESLMATEKWEEAEDLIQRVREMSEEDAARLSARLRHVQAR